MLFVSYGFDCLKVIASPGARRRGMCDARTQTEARRATPLRSAADMPLHPQVVRYLQQLRERGVRPVDELPLAAARAQAESSDSCWTWSEPVGHVYDDQVSACRPVPVRVYVPEVATVGVIAYFHGGGFVTGTIDSYDSFCRRLANRVPATVVSVGYRRAPEHAFPAAVEDAEAATWWVGSRAANLSDSNAFAIAGDSAGGNLATVVSRRLREAGHGGPALQILLYPFLDLSVAAMTVVATAPTSSMLSATG
jgi:acetyl esterase